MTKEEILFKLEDIREVADQEENHSKALGGLIAELELLTDKLRQEWINCE